MGLIRKQGFELKPGLDLLLSRTTSRGWSAWVERDRVPLLAGQGNPRLFEGSTAYQAQCAATHWLRLNGYLGEQKTSLLTGFATSSR